MVLQTLKNKIDNGARYFLVHKFPRFFQFYLVVEYPKSGGSWLGQMISSYFDIPFSRNSFPTYKMSLTHGHFVPTKNSKYINKIYLLMRDGRDVMVSFYYHSLIWNEKNKLSPKDVIYTRKKLNFSDYNDIRTNLPRFIEFVFDHNYSLFFKFNSYGNWDSFNRKWLEHIEKDNSNIIITKYEDLLKDTKKELTRLIDLTQGEGLSDTEKISRIVRKYSFESQSKRKRGDENTSNFLRKGVSGDWESKFSKESADIFDQYAGEMLIKLGYEDNHEWVRKVN